MLVSIVSGTYNRIASVQRMVESIRTQIPLGIAYEIVLVDGGSTDGTIEWATDQTDIVLIQHGELRGAIKAFCDGARAAIGQYVIMGNDDIQYAPYSIMKAIRYLETHPLTGAVAFADNRTAQLHGGNQYRVEHMPAIALDGTDTLVNYGQVAMFRGWLGDLVGWWGDTDSIISQARTYGGDNHLSSALWELGYSVDGVAGCQIDDLIVRDGLRTANNGGGDTDSKLYYQRWPKGAQLKDSPQVASPDRERLRVLLMDIHEQALPARKAVHTGLRHALAQVGLVWQIDYVNEEYDLAQIVETWQPHLLITQAHDVGKINSSELAKARLKHPSMVIVNWNGDAHEKGLTSPDVLQMLRYVDLQLVNNAKVLPAYNELGINAAYWQIGIAETPPYPHRVPAHDLLFQGNCYSQERRDLIDTLKGSGFEVGLYGTCQGSIARTHYDFAQQTALYAAATITISDTFPGTEAFVSNRLFQALAAGAFVAQQYSPRLDEYTGLQAGVHYIKWQDLEDLKMLIAKWMLPEYAKQRRKIAQAGQSFAQANFSYPEQVRKLWSLLAA